MMSELWPSTQTNWQVIQLSLVHLGIDARWRGPAGPMWITVPLHRASQNGLISDIEIVSDDRWQVSLQSRVRQNYGAAVF